MWEAVAKFLDVFKLSGWQSGMIAAAAGLFLYLSHVGVLPPLESWMVLIGWVVVFVFGALAAASLGSTIQAAVGKAWARFLRKRRYKQARDAFTVDIPFLNEKERQILGYLREKKQRRFEAARDGGYANTLLGKGYVHYILVPGQTFYQDDVPMTVAEHVWEVINERPDDFPYKPERSDRGRGTEVHPWRKPSWL